MKLYSALFALAVIAAGCSSGTVGPPPKADDVQAARACEAFVKYGGGKDTSAQVLDAARPLLNGAAAGTPGPWEKLGSDILSSTSDAQNGDTAKLAADSADIPSECGSIPASAKQAGGFVK